MAKKVKSLEELIEIAGTLRQKESQFKLRREKIEGMIKSMMKPGDQVQSASFLGTYKETVRLLCLPSALEKLLPKEEFFACLKVQNDIAKNKLGADKFKEISQEVPYQKQLLIETRKI